MLSWRAAWYRQKVQTVTQKCVELHLVHVIAVRRCCHIKAAESVIKLCIILFLLLHCSSSSILRISFRARFNTDQNLLQVNVVGLFWFSE